MSTNIKRLISSFILIAFCFYITPKEVLHLFTHHEDTEHHVVNPNERHFEKEHHHCELLKIDQAFSAQAVELPFFDFIANNDFYINPSECLTNSFFSHFSCSSKQLRAPPVFVG